MGKRSDGVEIINGETYYVDLNALGYEGDGRKGHVIVSNEIVGGRRGGHYFEVSVVDGLECYDCKFEVGRGSDFHKAMVLQQQSISGYDELMSWDRTCTHKTML